jgi:hypothetical protein
MSRGVERKREKCERSRVLGACKCKWVVCEASTSSERVQEMSLVVGLA